MGYDLSIMDATSISRFHEYKFTIFWKAAKELEIIRFFK